jgi:hypothetical protein
MEIEIFPRCDLPAAAATLSATTKDEKALRACGPISGLSGAEHI